MEGQYATTSREPGPKIYHLLGIVWGQNSKTHKDILQVYPVYLWYVYLGLFQFTFLWGIFFLMRRMDQWMIWQIIGWWYRDLVRFHPKKRHTGMLLMIFIQRILTYLYDCSRTGVAIKAEKNLATMGNSILKFLASPPKNRLSIWSLQFQRNTGGFYLRKNEWLQYIIIFRFISSWKNKEQLASLFSSPLIYH